MPKTPVSERLADLAMHYSQSLVSEMVISSLSLTVTAQVTDILAAAAEWRAARMAFLGLPPGSPDVRTALNRLAAAENHLSVAVLQAART